MKKLLLSLILFSVSYFLSAQFTVHFVVLPPAEDNDTIYLAGNFNNWNPGDPNHRLVPLDEGRHFITVKLVPGHYEFKFTRGNWTKVESTEAGLDISNREVEINRDTTIRIKIEGWIDRFKDISKLPDTTQWKVAYLRSFFYLERNLDSSYKYAQLANRLVQKTENKANEAAMARILGRVMQRQGNHQKALEYYFKQLKLSQELNDTTAISFCLLDIGHLFLGIKDYEKAKAYYYQVINSYDAYAYGHSAPLLAMVRMGKIYYDTRRLDSGRYYAQRAYNISLTAIDRRSQSESLTLLGDILRLEGKAASAIDYYHQAVEQALLYNSSSLVAENYQHIALAFSATNQTDSAFYYARKAYSIAMELNNPFIITDASYLLVTLFKKSGQTDSAFKYMETVVAAKDSLFSQDKTQQLQNVIFNEQLQQQEMEAKEQKLHDRIKFYAVLAGLAVCIALALILHKNNKNKQKANKLLQQQKEQLQKALTKLKATQAQLVQQEKMASLGELTAGIAHEIQNPLNFMNNFSEVNKDLIEEMAHEIERGNNKGAKAIATEIRENENKINFHGKRADSIVRNMLQHARKHTGHKEPTDINALANEYMRLGYHGLRAKDKSFNATLQTDFDERVGKINVVPQDLARVLLNLYNNAFYAVSKKKKQAGDEYEPTVSVSTKRKQNAVEIRIRDNGMGIPRKNIDKIFQPFFTTKPVGEGTGLGLSLSYDIITKGHGGEMKVDTEEGEYAEFIVQLPA